MRSVDFGRVIPWKTELLGRAALSFQGAQPESRAKFEAFCAEQAGWLDDYALFAALKEHFRGAVWNAWPREIAHREPAAGTTTGIILPVPTLCQTAAMGALQTRIARTSFAMMASQMDSTADLR